MDVLFNSPTEVLAIVGAIVSIYVAFTAASKNRAESRKWAQSGYSELAEGAERLLKPLNDRIASLEQELIRCREDREKMSEVFQHMSDGLHAAINQLKDK